MAWKSRTVLCILLLGTALVAQADTIAADQSSAARTDVVQNHNAGIKPGAEITDAKLTFMNTEATKPGATPRGDGRQGGDTCATATDITGLLPISVSGMTIGYNNDYDEACPYTGSTAPDVVYKYTAAADVVVDITLCTGATNYDTKLYVYENTCPDTGNPYACNDDACSSPAFANYVSEIAGLSLTSGNTYYIIVDGYGTEAGSYYLDITEGTPPPQCPPDTTLFGQDPEMSGWWAGTSEVSPGYTRADNFWGVPGQICDIHFWGITAYFSSSWMQCFESPMPFEIKFWTNQPGSPDQPGTVVWSQTVTLNGVQVGVFGDYALYEYNYTIDPCIDLQDGWVSVVGAGSTTCWFLWAGASSGDSFSMLSQDGGNTWTPEDDQEDLALCLTGIYTQFNGACCDEVMGTCQENVLLEDCQGRFISYDDVPAPACDDFDPPCVAAIGACCFTDGTCQLLTFVECEGSPLCPGDMDCDGDIDFDDINPFVLALGGEAGYLAQYPNCFWLNGDCDSDGDVDFDDINYFVALIGTQCPPPGAGGTWLGPNTTCDMCPCQIAPCPPEGTPEGELCGEDLNGGCNTNPPVFTPIALDQTVCGFTWADGGTRDTDWFETVVTPPPGAPAGWGVEFTFAGESEVPIYVAMVEQTTPGVPGCDNTTGYIAPYAALDPCVPGGITTQCFPPGTYYFWVGPQDYAGYPCTEVYNDYTITLTGTECIYLCEIECPPMATPEGEPDCADEYVDTYNGGCNSEPPAFQAPLAGDGTDLICGRSGTFTFGGESYRDTDWYVYNNPGGRTKFRISLQAEFAVSLFVMGTTNQCASYEILDQGVAEPCGDELQGFETICLPDFPTYYFFIAPTNFTGVPCGALAEYIFWLENVETPCTVCQVTCDVDDQLEVEQCGQATNDLCDASNDQAEVIVDPDWNSATAFAICGSAWADAGLYDVDWYKFTIPAGVDGQHLIFLGNSEIPLRGLLLEGACPDPWFGYELYVVCGDGLSGFYTNETYPSTGQDQVWRVRFAPGYEIGGQGYLLDDGYPCGGGQNVYEFFAGYGYDPGAKSTIVPLKLEKCDAPAFYNP